MLKMLGYDITEEEYGIILIDLWKGNIIGHLSEEKLFELIPRLKK